MHGLAEDAPKNANDAFAHLNTLDSPGADDLKLMVLLEAAGKPFYDHLAERATDPGVSDILRRNGREELAHAHRMSRAIGRMTGQDYPVPPPEENPYCIGPMPEMAIDAAMLRAFAEGEFGGDALYERWASHCDDAEIAALYRQNGREEAGHGTRLRQAAELLAR